MSAAQDRARELLAGITPGKWERRIGPDDQTPAEFIAGIDGVDGEPLHVVIAPSPEDRYASVVPAITGNGPTSRVNAEFIAAAPDLVRDLLAELDQAQAGRDMWGRTADTLGGNLEDVGHILSGVRYDEAEDVYRAANRVVAERDAALATLAEVREVADNDDLDVLPKLVRILIALDRGPR